MSSSNAKHQQVIVDADQQHNVVSRRQLLTIGWTPSNISAQLKAHRWQQLRPGIYLMVTGTPSIEAWWWAAHLYCGERSVLAGASALQVWGLAPRRLPVVIGLPTEQRILPVEGLLIIRRHVEARPVRSRKALPPAVVVEHALLDVINEMDSVQDVKALLTLACREGGATPGRIERALNYRSQQRHRKKINELLFAIGDGSTSVLEIDGVRNVLKRHGLPVGRGQVREKQDGKDVLRDRKLDPWPIYLEFDGRLGHDDAYGQFRDMKRDNVVSLRSGKTLRFGWIDVQDFACEAALQVAEALCQAGWTGNLKPCGRHCRAVLSAS